MKTVIDKISGPFRATGKNGNDSLNNSLDTTSSMNTAESDSTYPSARDASFGDFPDCPFLGHRLYAPIKEHFKQAMGLLYLARRRDTGEKVLIKLIDRGASVTRHVASELLLHWQCCGHPLFAQLIDVFLAPKHLAIVMELIPGGDILELVESQGHLPEDQARGLFQQVVVGVLFLHSKGACHREIKLQNKLLAWDDNDSASGGGGAHKVNGVLSRLSPSATIAAATARAHGAPIESGPGAVTTPVASTAAAGDGPVDAIPMERSPSPIPSLAAMAGIPGKEPVPALLSRSKISCTQKASKSIAIHTVL